MLSSHSVIRRYTPPTCTLEISAKSSPLSRWAGRTLLKELRFKLSFDDPRIIQEELVNISGDREQLEMLCDVVSTYVKNFLQQPASQLALITHSNVKNDNNNFPKTTAKEAYSSPIDSNGAPPEIKSQGMLAHELFFGSLASATSGEKIGLSALQLFDLANALDKYQAEIDALPSLVASERKSALPIWASAAAVILVAVVLTSTRLGLFTQQSKPQSDSIASSGDPTADNNSANSPDVVPPAPPQAKTTPTPSPKLPETLASAERLPPPPPVDLPKPPPANVPDPSKYPFRDLAKAPNSLNKIPSPPPPTTKANLDRSSGAANTNQEKEIVQIPELPPLVPQSPNSNATQSEIAAQPSPDRGESPAIASDPVKLAAADRYNSEKVLERIPQIAELQDYFQKRWKPPEGLTQNLEYRLVLNNNGSIKSIIPLGKASEINLDRTNIPLMGESFISPFQDQPTPIVRLVFSPDGEVKTFTE
jgi:hypothetical protein